MTKIKFGFKRLVKKEEELAFSFPYLVMEPRPEDTGKVCKFRLKGENIRDLLEFKNRENKLSWLFDENDDNTFYLINVTDAGKDEVDPLIRVNLALDFNSKPLYDRMEKLMGVDPKETHYFEIIKVEPIEGFPTVKIDAFAESSVEEEKAELANEDNSSEATVETQEEKEGEEKLETII